MLEALAAEARAAETEARWDVALARWNQIRQYDPAHAAEPHLGLARALHFLQEGDRALEALDLGIEHFPGDGELHRARGRLLIELGFRRAAELDLEAVCLAFPSDPLAWCELAQVQADLCCPNLASDTFELALALDGCPPTVVSHVARVNVAAERHARARELFVAAIERAPEDCQLLAQAVAATVAWCESDDEDLAGPTDAEIDVAIAWGELLCAFDPQDGDAHVLVGTLCERRTFDDRAEVLFRRAVEVDNLDLDALRRLARLYVRVGRHDQACAMFERALLLEGDPGRAASLESERDAARRAAEAKGAAGSDVPGAQRATVGDAAAVIAAPLPLTVSAGSSGQAPPAAQHSPLPRRNPR